ncbi:hypothetical protein E2C01_032844 [Portunus trituberculatus]|uniref:Secreted protein n=1 Tax=Portunus trituberculatus TaxID=210409 RepID=A0A5B7F2K3_PORTR|nr:hypothetical protein [Portunus trituberculatus]
MEGESAVVVMVVVVAVVVLGPARLSQCTTLLPPVLMCGSGRFHFSHHRGSVAGPLKMLITSTATPSVTCRDENLNDSPTRK